MVRWPRTIPRIRREFLAGTRAIGSKEAEAGLSFRNDCVDVDFAQPQKAVTPGQAIVFYNVDEVLGGGIISEMQRLECKA